MSAITKSLIILAVTYCMHTGITKATFYREVSLPGSIENDISAAPILINKGHYQCSIEDTCNYVVKDLRSLTYTTHNKEEELPSMSDWYRIWRKMPDAEKTKFADTNIGVSLASVSSTCKIQKRPNSE